jgi:iron complex outermembrane receptor protein
MHNISNKMGNYMAITLKSRLALWTGVSMAAVIGAASLGGVASAQTAVAAPPSDAGAATPSTAGEVIVTAQRRSERLQDVPIAVSNFTASQIDQQQIHATDDIPRLIPNMTVTNNTGTGSGNVYFLRGLGQTESFATFDPQVGQYVDDIYIGRGSAANFGLFDVDNIEVLRGPQGTLFGRNSTGGAIVISLAKPKDTFGGYVDIGYGAYNRVFGSASVNIPINDQVLTRSAIYGVRDDGYVDDVTTGQKLNAHGDVGFREAVLLKPANLSNVTWNLSADTEESTYNAVQNSPIDGKRISYSGFGVLSAPTPVVGAAPIFTDFANILKESATSLANGEDLKTWGAMSNIAIRFSSGTLNIITGLRGQDQLGAADFPFPAVSGALVPFDQSSLGQFGIALNSTDRQYSQEVKWNGEAFGGKLNYTGGLFYLYEQNNTAFVETLTVPIAAATSFGLELSSPEHFHNETYSAAGYLQGDYHVTDKLTFTLGARYTDERKYYDVNALSSAAGATGYDTADVVADGNANHLHTDKFTPRIALQYKLTPDIMTFISATEGFQGGGWNSLTQSAQLVTAFRPETVWTYEGGVRTEWLEKKLILNADVFYNNVDNYQLITLGPGGGANFVTENAASMEAYGLEVDATYHPIRDLTLSGTLGLQNGFYFHPSAVTVTQEQACASGNTGDCVQGIVDATGKLAPPEDFPKASFNLFASYVWRLNTFDLTPNAAVQYMSGVHVDTSGAAAGFSPDHALLDLGLKFQLHNTPWSITAECQNCLMTNYQTQLLFLKYYNNPGIWDIRAKYTF